MSTPLIVDAGAIEGTILQLELAMDGIQQDLTFLDIEVASLATQWTGEASDAYQKAQKEWSASMEQNREWLSRLIKALADTLAIYTSAESDVVRVSGG